MGGGGEGGAFGSEIPERGSLENLDTDLLFEVTVQTPACASQIVSHILRHIYTSIKRDYHRMHTKGNAKF